jgi:hypothetical protein
MPGVAGTAFPCALPDLPEVLSRDVEHGSFLTRDVAELAPRHGAHALLLAQEHAIAVEDLHVQLLLERLERAEHPIDRAAGALVLRIGGDDEKASLAQLARAANRRTVGSPFVEKRIDLLQHGFALRGVERGGNSEDPDVSVVAELFDGDSHRRGVY